MGQKKQEKPAEIIDSPPEILDTGEEMRKLRKDNDRLKEEVEILKKLQRSLQRRTGKVRLDLFSLNRVFNDENV